MKEKLTTVVLRTPDGRVSAVAVVHIENLKVPEIAAAYMKQLVEDIEQQRPV
jgi:hypothetical protein